MNLLRKISQSNFRLILSSVSFLLVVIFCVNSLSPLRLHIDAIRYFVIKDCIEYGCPPDSNGATDYLPFGYTALLLLLSKLKILKSFTLVIINCIYLFASLLFVKRIFDKNLNFYLFLVLVLLNWTIIKFATHPLSEMQYIFFSICSIYYFKMFDEDEKLKYLIFSFFLALISYLTRTIGIALIASLVIGIIWKYRMLVLLFLNRNKVVLFVVILSIISVGLFSKQFGINHYLKVFNTEFAGGLKYQEVLRWHSVELTEIFLNTSFSRLKTISSNPILPLVFAMLGVVFFISFIWLMVIHKKSISVVVIVYILLYSLIIFNWPFYDPRFWVPIVPLIIAILSISLQGFKLSPLFKTKYLIISWLLLYTGVGIISVGYYTYTSFNKKVFVSTQASGSFKREYEEVLFNKNNGYEKLPAGLDSTIVHILTRYN